MSAFNLAKRLQERRAAGGDETPDIIDFMGDLTGKPVPKQAHDGLRSIVMTNDGGMVFEGVELTPTGLVFPDGGISREIANSLLDLLLALEGSVAWMLGDMLVNLEIVYGVTYQTVAAERGKDVDLLYDYKSIADKIRFPYRYGNLSWTHHRTVAYLDEGARQMWLERALEFGWSVSRLRNEINAATAPQIEAKTSSVFIPPAATDAMKRLSKLTLDRVAAMDAAQLHEARRQYEAVVSATARVQRALQEREQALKLDDARRGRW